MTDEYKKFLEIEGKFQDCVSMATDSGAKRILCPKCWMN